MISIKTATIAVAMARQRWWQHVAALVLICVTLVEVALLYPWAVVYQRLGLLAFIEASSGPGAAPPSRWASRSG